MFVDLDWPLNASSLLSASAELLVYRPDALPVAKPTVSKHWSENCAYTLKLRNACKLHRRMHTLGHCGGKDYSKTADVNYLYDEVAQLHDRNKTVKLFIASQHAMCTARYCHGKSVRLSLQCRWAYCVSKRINVSSHISPYSSWTELAHTPFTVKANSHTFLLN